MTDSLRLTNRAGADASWFADAKLGIMVSWGLYSIPGWAPLDPRLTESLGAGVTSDGGDFSHMSPLSTTSYAEWYLNSMSLVGTPTWLYHQANYAGAAYDAFRAPFDAAVAACEPADWVALSQAAGAKYIVPLTKHHVCILDQLGGRGRRGAAAGVPWLRHSGGRGRWRRIPSGS